MRSSTPPCPGKNDPESFKSTDRLSIDSTRSPTWPTTPKSTTKPIRANYEIGNQATQRPFYRLSRAYVGRKFVSPKGFPNVISSRVPCK